jgi:mycoredoxin
VKKINDLLLSWASILDDTAEMQARTSATMPFVYPTSFSCRMPTWPRRDGRLGYPHPPGGDSGRGRRGHRLQLGTLGSGNSMDTFSPGSLCRSGGGNSRVRAGVTRDMTITMYGADWCSDCRRAKRVLDGSGVAWDYVNLEADDTAADRAHAISGRTNIPVIVFSDGSHAVEPSDNDLRARISALVT